MKFVKWSFILLCVTFFSISCNSCKDNDKEDLTQDIIGEYIGKYSSNSLGDVNDYIVIVSKVNDERIKIAPKTGNEFDVWEINLEQFNSSTITATIGQIDPTIFFSIGDSKVGMNFQRANEGDEYTGDSQ